jgi:alcohol dehydrogenase class IV
VKFEFATSARVVFGPGSLPEAGPAAAAVGRRALVVTGKNTDRAEPLLNALADFEVETEFFSVAGEPTVEMVRSAAAKAREAECDLTVAFGGGSAVDTAKAAAALLTNDGDVLDYLEVIGEGRKLERPAAPCIAVPTTAGTGAEVTRNAVIASPEERVKVSLRHASMIPDLALVDPELTLSAPPDVTAASGLDALSQLIEPFVSRMANPLTDALCREGLPRAARSLPVACADGSNRDARADMCAASLLSGMALANAKLGAVHGIAGPFGGMFPGAAHGAVCARLLPAVTAVNVKALADRGLDASRYAEVARALTGSGSAGPADAVTWLEELCAGLDVPRLRSYGLSASDYGPLAERAARASSMKGNPVELSAEELREVFERAV